eukprot:XP_011663572.1 PREDICTED: short-chain dehydrogenase TIC 32, chloroplastic [Strongylocentrotus purpuratus]
MSESEPTPSAADHNATEQTDQTTEQAVEVPEPEGEETQVTCSGPADQVVEVAEEVDKSNNVDEPKDGVPKVVIITGANTGIGLVAAEMLAKDDYEVIMACRSEDKANQAVSEVQKKVPGAKVSFMKLDLNSLKSVREFSDAFHATGKPLHVLCNNAGLTTGFSTKDRLETEDGFEMTFGVNHLGHFLLTHLLLDVMKKTAETCEEVRIVNTSSMLHDPEGPGGNRGRAAHLDFDNLMMDKPDTFDGMLAYRNSKLANCAFSVELAKRLEGSKITSNTLCPGFIPATGLGRNETQWAKIRMAVITPLLKLIGITRTVEHGGGMVHYVVTSPDWKGLTGKHSTDFKITDSSTESRDPEVGKKLWDMSADLVQYEAAKTL